MAKANILISLLLGGVVLTSCSSSMPSTQSLPVNKSEQAAMLTSTENSTKATETASTPARRPQLIKKANLSIAVDSVEKSIDAIAKIIDKQQGDLIKLEERQPNRNGGLHTAVIQLRVPQNLLEPTLGEIAKLGNVENRNITAEDVSEQLVDIQARLANLRRTETNLQKIMDRADSVKDILSVSQELSRVRQSIEQIDAQLKNLQNQVAYSNITVNIESAVPSSSPQKALGSQMQETWNSATNTFGKFSVGLLKLCIWLFVYSPYLALIGLGIYAFRRWKHSQKPVMRLAEFEPDPETPPHS